MEHFGGSQEIKSVSHASIIADTSFHLSCHLAKFPPCHGCLTPPVLQHMHERNTFAFHAACFVQLITVENVIHVTFATFL